MGKIIRNTIFTVIIITLTAVGLHWNHQVSAKADPVQISQTVLTAADTTKTQPFPLTVTFDKPHLKLGQTQTLQVTTTPGAALKLVTIYPNGSINNPQTVAATADETGHYSLTFKLDDFTFLGVFETKVVATSNDAQAEASALFALQTWIGSDTPIANDQTGYLYPLVP